MGPRGVQGLSKIDENLI
jgi:hypothetical protein